MFKFLKDKLKSAVAKLSKQVDEEAEPIEEELKAEKKEAKTEPRQEAAIEKKEAEKREELAEEIVEEAPKPKKRGFFGKLFGRKEKTSEEKEEELDKELEEELDEFEEELEEVKYEEAPAEIEQEKPAIEEKKEDIEAPAEEESEFREKVKDVIEEEALPKEDYEEEKAKVQEEKLDQYIEETKAPEQSKHIEEKKHEPAPARKHIVEEEPEEKKGFFGRIKEGITKKAISAEKFESIFWELEVALMENNVAVEVIGKIKEDLKKELVEKKVLRGKTEEIIISTLRNSIEELLTVEGINLIEKIREKKDKPYVIVFVGINGTGKTTTIAKIVRLLQKNSITSAIAASDTFRAAAIQQLEEHADKLGVKLIKHDYGADPAAVAFDTIKYAKAKNIDCVLIDTAGRLHSNTNLMDEMKKIIRVAKPDMKIFIGDSLTGNDCVEQSREFNNAIGIDAIILAKADVDEKGGAALSVSYITKKPIIYLGMGQTYDSLEPFDAEKILQRLGLEA